MFRADFENVVVCKQLKTEVSFKGSGGFKIGANGLPCKKESPRPELKKREWRKMSGVEMKEYRAENNIPSSVSCNYPLIKCSTKRSMTDDEKRARKMNKKKVRGKILAYSQLPASQKFMAFYSISFPCGMSDEQIRKIHNSVLTRLRKIRKNFSYVWIAEKQKNGTLHFHMVTNSWFNIRVINRMYGVAISNRLQRDESNIRFELEKYNGVDVKLIKNINTVSKYVTKYVTKNDTDTVGLKWNCSKDISGLFTSVHISFDDFMSFVDRLEYVDTFVIPAKDGYDDLEFNVFSYGRSRPKKIMNAINLINRYLMKWHFKGINLN